MLSHICPNTLSNARATNHTKQRHRHKYIYFVHYQT